MFYSGGLKHNIVVAYYSILTYLVTRSVTRPDTERCLFACMVNDGMFQPLNPHDLDLDTLRTEELIESLNDCCYVSLVNWHLGRFGEITQNI